MEMIYFSTSEKAKANVKNILKASAILLRATKKIKIKLVRMLNSLAMNGYALNEGITPNAIRLMKRNAHPEIPINFFILYTEGMGGGMTSNNVFTSSIV